MGKVTATVEDHLILPARVLQTRGQERLFHLGGRVIPAPVPVRLLVDTGSRRSTLLPGILAHVQAPFQGSVGIETSLGIGKTSLFWVRLEFPDTSLEPIPQLAVARLNMPASLHPLHGVIGRDLLHRWESFLFEGRRGRFTIRDVPWSLFGWLRG